MSTTKPNIPPVDPGLRAAYDEAEKDFRVQQAIIGCVLVLICMPAGFGLDWFVYPQFLVKFLLIGRLLCDVPVLALYLMLKSRHARQYITVIDKIWPALPAISISWMIYMTEGVRSPYYAGLNLVMIVACLLMPYSLREAVFVCAATLATYLTACIAHAAQSDVPIDVSVLYSNSYFILITALICVCSCHYNRKRRIHEFMLRRELDQRNQELAEMDRLKSEFFANVSHELRTPLTLILAPTNALLTEPERLAEPVRRTLDVIRQNGLRLLKLITDLLEVVRLDERRSTLQRERLDLVAFARGTLESVRHLANQKSLQLRYEGSNDAIIIDADATRIEKVLLNLLSNAIKFTPPGGRIAVELRTENGEAVLAVSDTGVGIPAKQLPVLFQRFRQVDGSATRRFQGMGIGLALARELVQEHGGSMEVHSEEHKGATFTVRLPQRIETPSAAPAVPRIDPHPDPIAQIYHDANRTLLNPHAPLDWDELSGVQGTGNHSIVVIEDEPDLRRFVVSMLAKSYSVRQAEDGQRGLDAVKAYRPDLVVLDLMLPEIDGLEVCRRIKADPETAQTRVLLLTARADDQSRLTALRNGVSDFLCKPFSSEELCTRIANLIRGAELEREVMRRNQELTEALEKLKATEAQLVASEKMNAVGQLSAGILHEINNPLNAAMMAARVSQRKNTDPTVAECLTDITAAMQRISAITNDLRSFAHPGAASLGEVFTLQSAVDSARQLLSHELIGQDLLEIRLADAPVTANRNQIVHLLINVLNNAIQATRDNPRPARIAITSKVADDRVVVTVEDNGHGIGTEHLARVTEPFYTTRDVGRGMGLGLSICHTIVKNHGGRLTIESEPSHWTRVTFDLPLNKGNP